MRIKRQIVSYLAYQICCSIRRRGWEWLSEVRTTMERINRIMGE